MTAHHRIFASVLITLSVFVIFFGGRLVLADMANSSNADIAVDQFKNGETLRYALPFLQGSLADASIDKVSVANLSNHGADREHQGVAYKGRFKVFASLVPGSNDLLLTAGSAKTHLTLSYKPQTNPHFIRAVLFTDNTGNTNYETPVPNDTQDYQGKFDTLLKMMQSYTADWMNHYGYGRRTFNIETDQNGKVIVHVVKGAGTADHYRYDMNRDGLYDSITNEVIKNLPEAQSVDCTLIAFSNMDRKLGHSVAYTALGGGKVALFGGACMYSFPNTIDDIQPAFTNGTYIDSKMYVSDSVDRFTFWGTASTSLGAMLHEMGHSMGLPHSNDPWDIMTRGIDNFGRYFVFYDPPSKRNPDTFYFTPQQVGYWSPVSAAALAPTVWLTVDAKPHLTPPAATTVTLSPDGSDFTIENKRGIGFVGFEKPGVAHSFAKIDYKKPLPQKMEISADHVFSAVATDTAQFRILDGNGDMTCFPLNEYNEGFLRRWHVMTRPVSWTTAPTLPDLSDQQLKTFFNQVIEQSAVVSGSGEVNLPGDVSDNAQLSYAAIALRSDDEQPVSIHTGSQGTLRLWINGVLVCQSDDTGKGKPDSRVDSATLKAGINAVLVEVGHSRLPGAFFARVTNSQGNSLQLASDGHLVELKPKELIQPKT